MMKHHIFRVLPCVVALTSLSCGAHAQSNVTISGFLDIGVYDGFDNAEKQVGTIQRSNIAISGVEDLGGGISATFKLSHRLEMDTGTEEVTASPGKKPFWHGESTIGLKSGLGHLRLGRALDVVFANDWAYDPWYNFNRIASPAWNLWHYNYSTDRTGNRGVPEYGRLSNGVFYDSPSWNGVTLHLSGAFEDSTEANAGRKNNFGTSLNYNSKTVSLMAARSENSSGDTVNFFGGKYTLGNLQLMGAYDVSVFNLPVDDLKDKVATLGAVYGLGATALKAGFGYRDGVSNDNEKFVGLGIDHSLSKRTTFYVSAGHKRPELRNSSSAYGVGLSHSF